MEEVSGARDGLPEPTRMKETSDMAQYLISVWHDDVYDDDPDWSDPELQRRGAQVGALTNAAATRRPTPISLFMRPAPLAPLLDPV